MHTIRNQVLMNALHLMHMTAAIDSSGLTIPSHALHEAGGWKLPPWNPL